MSPEETRFTGTMCKILMADIKRLLITPHYPPYAVSIDAKEAFENMVMLMLAKVGVSINVLNLLVAILLENRIIIDDGAVELSTGLAQEDNLNPLLFFFC